MSNLIKLVISVLIVSFIIYKVDFSSVWSSMLNAKLDYLVIALLLLILSQVVAAYRWSLIMGLLDYTHPLSFYLKSYFKGALFNQLLPTSIGGDAYRVAEVKAHGGRTREAFYGVFIDRIVGLIGLLVITLAASLLANDLLPSHVFYLINSLILAAFFGFFVLLALHKIHWFDRFSITRLFYDLSHRFRSVYKTPKRIAQQLALSILIHLLAMIAIFGIGHSVGINEPIATYLVIIPPAILLTVLPISFAGWGVREGALIVLFMMIGVEQAQVLAMSLLFGILLILAALPGLVFYLRSQHKYF
ncbi:lysylphosphatidylglycerol synthase transmembrane domain-containing protein [Thiomicrospira pelophila]|uniref:lysylphosphatidylglycerol synthase transmembrane domain-containing protein n=1 Tax=Thiomicrospira pelophila TaxID=934 RepID=UPI0004A720C2|nr:lysylphosphatidylglycerol synthase transmembrane domain-containing protein [Thiomicrospira pelophila]